MLGTDGSTLNCSLAKRESWVRCLSWHTIDRRAGHEESVCNLVDGGNLVLF